MVRITGTIEDSGGVGLSGFLRVMLDAPLSIGNKTLTLMARSFPVVDGDLFAANIDLEPSDMLQVTYRVMFYTVSLDKEMLWLDFHCIIPAVASIDITMLLPTGIVRETMDTSIIRLANLISDDAYFSSKLSPLIFVGVWQQETLYYRGNVVSFDGSSYVYKLPLPSIGNSPLLGAFWQLLASRGVTGTGTLGSATGYGASWESQNDAPSRGAIFNLVENVLVKAVTVANLAPIISPIFTGLPTAPTAAINSNTSQIANTEWVTNYAVARLSPTLDNSPSLGSNNKSIATTEWVTNSITSAGGFGGGASSIDLSAYAQLASPTFTGTPRVPSPPALDSSTRAVNSQWVNTRIDAMPAPTGVTVTTSGGATTYNYGGGNLMMMGVLSVNRATWNYLTWIDMVVNFPFSLSVFHNVQVSWRSGLSSDTGYMKHRVINTSETSITISAMWSNSYFSETGSFYWLVAGRQ